MLYCTQEKHHYFFCRGMFWNSVFIACICFVISVLCSHIMSCFFLILYFSPLKFSFQLHDYTRSRANSESVNVETPLPVLTVITIGGSFPTCCCFYRIITYKPSICTWSQRYSGNAYHGNVSYWTMILLRNVARIPPPLQVVRWIAQLSISAQKSPYSTKGTFVKKRQVRTPCKSRLFVLSVIFVFYPRVTSSTIINAKPMAKPMVPILLCSPSLASGISSSTTT